MNSFCSKTPYLFLRTLISQSRRQYAFSTEALPVITMPVTMKAHLKKLKLKKKIAVTNQRVDKSRRGTSNVPIISCKRTDLNHWKNQTYDKFKALPLASKGWHHRKSKGDYFMIHSYGSNPAFLNENENQTPMTFNKLGLSTETLQAIEELGLKEPTNIQMKAIPEILKGKSVICAAETGCGKTLTYLIPILENIWKYKMVATDTHFNSPMCLILVPSRELAEQVGTVCKTFGEKLSLKTKVLIGGKGQHHLLLFNPPAHTVDIMVSTLGVLNKITDNKIYSMERIRHIIIDEADTMFDDSFNDDLGLFLSKFSLQLQVNPVDPNHNGETQLCLVSATLPRDLQNILQIAIDVDGMEKIYTEHLHCLLPHIPQKFLRIKGAEKPAKLLEMVKSDLKKKKAVMVFCKNRSTSDFVNIFLEENGIPNTTLNGDMNAKFRQENLNKFLKGEVNIISCTDIGSRGLDTVRVQHLINYDFPTFMSDYIHRAGRTGRVGSNTSGHITSFVSKAYEVDLLQKIEIAARTVGELPNVNANIKRKLNSITS